MPNWAQVQNEISQEAFHWHQQSLLAQAKSQQALDTVRRRYLDALSKETGRHVIAYYSGFLSKSERADINDEDKNGFMMAVHRLKPRWKGLDLVLHTPGGNIASTQSIVDYLQKMFDRDIRAIIPQIAMSAGAMIACSCKEIVMGKESNLGPIDPQMANAPAYGIISEFERAYKDIKGTGKGIDQAKAIIWQWIIGQYKPSFLGQCENAIEWSNKFVEDQLTRIMFGPAKPADKQTPKEKRAARAKAKSIVKHLTDYSKNKSHNRHIHAEECKTIGLKVVDLEAAGNDKLQDLVLTVHHCYMHSLMNTNAYKIIENNMGDAFVKQTVAIGKPPTQQHPPLPTASPELPVSVQERD